MSLDVDVSVAAWTVSESFARTACGSARGSLGCLEKPLKPAH